MKYSSNANGFNERDPRISVADSCVNTFLVIMRKKQYQIHSGIKFIHTIGIGLLRAYIRYLSRCTDISIIVQGLATIQIMPSCAA
jgi:hypothetical protein